MRRAGKKKRRGKREKREENKGVELEKRKEKSGPHASGFHERNKGPTFHLT